jgi:hypothetical protein
VSRFVKQDGADFRGGDEPALAHALLSPRGIVTILSGASRAANELGRRFFPPPGRRATKSDRRMRDGQTEVLMSAPNTNIRVGISSSPPATPSRLLARPMPMPMPKPAAT